ncbi:cytochrome P450 [Streptomyces sp. NBC_00247]|uniref:cytochrome P450 n=1 Tax=Streptomyces sp. NBC_00247 TaxID=2975689 RepID=UPI002E2D9F65|nr:cytochrome P450 [Streptomyces sp. NBC_00247]
MSRVLLDPRADLREQATALHAYGSVVPAQWPGGVDCWAVVGYDELETVLSDPLFSRSPLHFRALRDGEIPPDWPMTDHLNRQWMLTADGADHTRLRRTAVSAFTPGNIRRLRPEVESAVGRLLAGLVAAGRPFDLRAEFALPLALDVLCSLLGVPAAERAEASSLVHRALSRAALTADESRRLSAEIRGFLGGLLERPGRSGGLVADLARSVEAEALTRQEAQDTLWLFLAAGFDTTVAALVNAVRALLGHPDRLRGVLGGEVPWEDVVEEALRYDSSVFALPFAFPRRDVTLGGQPVREGDALLLCYTAANLDPRRTAGDRFTGSAPPRHLAFGRGPHYCLGAPLARLQLRTALAGLFTFLPHLRATARPGPPIASLTVNSPQSLMVSDAPCPAARHGGSPDDPARWGDPVLCPGVAG